jgi:hypothetical protein
LTRLEIVQGFVAALRVAAGGSQSRLGDVQAFAEDTIRIRIFGVYFRTVLDCLKKFVPGLPSRDTDLQPGLTSWVPFLVGGVCEQTEAG